jgi:hypothetical protein
MRQAATGLILLVSLAAGPAVHAQQGAVGAALGAPAQPKVAPPPAAPTVQAGAGGAAPAFPPPTSDDPDLAKAIQLAKDHGLNLDTAWYGQVSPITGERIGRPELPDLAKTDPKKAALRLTRLVYTSDVGRRPQDLGWTFNNGTPDPTHRLSGTLVGPDGRSYAIETQGLPLNRLEVAGMAANADGPTGSWWNGRRTSVAEGDSVRVRSSYVTDSGQVIDAPDVVVPLAGGARTVNLPGGGTLTLGVVTTPAPAPSRPPLGSP